MSYAEENAQSDLFCAQMIKFAVDYFREQELSEKLQTICLHKMAAYNMHFALSSPTLEGASQTLKEEYVRACFRAFAVAVRELSEIDVDFEIKFKKTH